MPRFKSTPRSILELVPPDPTPLNASPEFPVAEPNVMADEPAVVLPDECDTKFGAGSDFDECQPERLSGVLPIPPVTNAECFGSLHAAALFAQAAAVLAMGADNTFPLSNTHTPPIAPLGLSFLGLPHPVVDGLDVLNPKTAKSGPYATKKPSPTSKNGISNNRKRGRPRAPKRVDPSPATLFPCWLPANNAHVRTKLRLLAESENLDLMDLAESKDSAPDESLSSESEKKALEQTPVTDKTDPFLVKSSPIQQPASVPSPSVSPPPESPSPLSRLKTKPSSPTPSPSTQLQSVSKMIDPDSPEAQPSSITSLENQKPDNPSGDVQPQAAQPELTNMEESLAAPPASNPPFRRTRSSFAMSSGQAQCTPAKPPPTSHAKRPEGFVQCRICHKSLRKSSMPEHMARHDNSGKYKCTTCGITFSRRSAHEKHERIHTGEKPFKCEHCPKAYRQMAHLRDHLRSHSGERPFVCRLCGFASGYKSLLKRHLRTHGVSKHPNAVPNLWYKASGTKEEVMAVASEIGRQIESGEAIVLGEGNEKLSPSDKSDIELGRRQLCNKCPAGFPTFQALRSHQIVVHGLIRKHPCKTCGEEFASTGLRRQHARKAHPLVCPVCSKRMATLQRTELKEHMLAEHSHQVSRRHSSSIPAQSSCLSDETCSSPEGKKLKRESVPPASSDRSFSPRLREKVGSSDCMVMTWKRFCSVQSTDPINFSQTDNGGYAESESDHNSDSTSSDSDSDNSNSDSNADQTGCHRSASENIAEVDHPLTPTIGNDVAVTDHNQEPTSDPGPAS